MDTTKLMDAELLDELTADFLKTPFGQHYLARLKQKHVDLHDQAERQTEIVHAGRLVTEAKGVSFAISELTDASKRLDNGYYENMRIEDAELKANELSDITP